MPVCPILSIGKSAFQPCIGAECHLYIPARGAWEESLGGPGGWCGLVAPAEIRRSFFGPFLRDAAVLTPPEPSSTLRGADLAPATPIELSAEAVLADAASPMRVRLYPGDSPAHPAFVVDEGIDLCLTVAAFLGGFERGDGIDRTPKAHGDFIEWPAENRTVARWLARRIHRAIPGVLVRFQGEDFTSIGPARSIE